jgi:hypothetical protein
MLKLKISKKFKIFIILFFIFILSFLLSFALLDISYAILKPILSILFNVGICKGYKCSSFCCGVGSVYILYTLFLVPLSIFIWIKNKKIFAINIISFYVGVMSGIFVYSTTISWM